MVFPVAKHSNLQEVMALTGCIAKLLILVTAVSSMFVNRQGDGEEPYPVVLDGLGPTHGETTPLCNEVLDPDLSTIHFMLRTRRKVSMRSQRGNICVTSSSGKSVPGDGGSQLEARLEKTSAVHYICSKKSNDYFSLWLNLELLVPVVIDCWVDNMRLYYDNVSRTTSNSPGVDIRVPGFGDTFNVEWLDPSKASPGAYFNNIAASLVTLGLERNSTIRGAPYDFRKAPNENKAYLSLLKDLIEETATRTGKPVVIVAHSMGAPTTLHFLHQQSQKWKNQYVRSMVTLAGCWGGTVKAMKVFAQGDNLGVAVLSEATLREEQRTSPSLAWLMPSKQFWVADEVMVQTANKTYGVDNIQEFFHDIEYPIGHEMWLDTRDIIPDFKPPGVELHCLYGNGIETTESLLYTKPLPQGKAKLVTSMNGDGTVNLRSLEGCKRWVGKQVPGVFTKELPGRDHMAVLADPVVLAYIKAVVTGRDPNELIGLETNEVL